MVMNTARRVREGLAELIRAANDPATSTSDLQALLGECKAFGGQLAVLQADTAAGIAGRERHGDGGVGVLAQAVGLSRRDAAGQVKTAKQLEGLPSVRDAVENGDISVANAKVLAGACDKTSSEQVERDEELLAKAAVLSPEQLAREAGRWAAARQPDDGEELYRRQRARRRLSIFDGDDGMVLVRGELDPVTGAKVRKRFLQEAERLRRLDLHSPGADRRSFNQRMADALDTLTSHGSIYSRVAGATNGSGVGAGEVHSSGDGDTHSPGAGAGEGRSGGGGRASGSGVGGGGGRASGSGVGGGGGRASGSGVGGGGGRASGSGVGAGEGRSGGAGGTCGCGSKPSADITIVQHLDAAGTRAFAEIAGSEVIPQSVLEEHFCNAAIKGVVFSSEGVPLWHGHTKRRRHQGADERAAGPLRSLRGLRRGHVDL